MLLSRAMSAVEHVLRSVEREVVCERREVDIREFVESGEDDAPELTSIVACDSEVVHPYPWSTDSEPFERVVSLDGSSRMLRGQGVNLFLASVVAVSASDMKLVDYPPHFTHLSADSVVERFERAPFIAVQLRIRGGRERIERIASRLPLASFISLRSWNGRDFYDADYNAFQILDELRLHLETLALKVVSELWGQESTVIILDGPIYPTPRVCFRRGESRYKDAYRRLLNERVKVLRKLERQGVTVVGIVKRLGDSFKLYRIEEVNELLRRRLGFSGRLEKVADDYVLSMLVRYLRLRYPCVIGPFELRFSDRSFNELFEGGRAPPKVICYVYKPTSPYFTLGASVYRVEILSSSKSALERVLELLISLAHDTRRGVPLPISVADRLARMSTADAYLRMVSIMERYIVLPYETRVEVAEVERELRELTGA